jgi:hypothetical protein
MRALAFIRPGINVDPIVVDRVERILPSLARAIRDVPEEEVNRVPSTVERM